MIQHGPRTASDGEVRLREVVPADSPLLYRWRMDPANRPSFRDDSLVPFERHEAFLARYFEPGNRDRWFVVEAGGEPVGAIALYGFSPDGSEVEWGRFVIAGEHRRRGWGGRALALLVAHARALGVRRLRCEVVAGNEPAERLYRRLGFVDAGADEAGGRRFLHLVADLATEGD